MVGLIARSVMVLVHKLKTALLPQNFCEIKLGVMMTQYVLQNRNDLHLRRAKTCV